MNCFEDIFELLRDHHVLLCRVCQFAIIPNQVKTHLSKHHPNLASEIRVDIIEQVQAAPNLAHEAHQVSYPKPEKPPTKSLPIYVDGLACTGSGSLGRQCRYVCRTIQGIQEHCKTQHNWVNTQKRGGNAYTKQAHSSNRLWRSNVACQRFFKVGKWQRYFEVWNNDPLAQTYTGSDRVERFFCEQEETIQQSKRDAVEAANRVHGFQDHRSTIVPWLRTTGIAEHIRGLRKDEIQAAIALPSTDDEDILGYILDATEALLREAQSWCFDGPKCMLTWPCRVVLNRFQSAEAETFGRTRAFDPYKEPRTLQAYFKTAKQCLVYFDRVVVGREYYFSPGTDSEEENPRPEDVVQVTGEQRRVWRSIRQIARELSGAEDSRKQAGLQDELLKIWMLLIGHDTGTRRYRSPILSFCAMLSIKPTASSWIEPGNFNSHLSAMIWIVQLLIFYHSAQQELRGEGTTLQLVKHHCEKYLHQTSETPIGEMLRWRLLLFQISRDTVSTRQATWDESEQVLTYEDTELRMDQISALLMSEYNDCRRLLYNDLMFGTKDFRGMHAWELKDHSEVAIVDWSFTQHPDNKHLLEGSERMLLAAIQRSPHLCHLFLTEDRQAVETLVWRECAIASYEATVQEFLKRLSALIHISGGTPIRESEFFSMTWRNTQQQRSITLRHDRVMIHVTYHKGQQQTGKGKNNIRFLAHPIGELLLDYIVYVMHLRQIFQRQAAPNRVPSPFLWEKGGSVWPEGQLSRCLEQASIRAQIPRLHISNWRQMTVAIVKTKFASDIGCFEMDPNDEDAEELEADIRALTKQRNHQTRTVNRAYANQTGSAFGNVWDGLVRMGLRASTLWQNFWGVDAMISGKKRKQVEQEGRLTKRIAMGIYRPRKPWSVDALLCGLRQLYRDEGAQWKSPEQEQALCTIMSWTEQVVAIMPTGSGKSTLFLLPCTLPDAGTTILIVPLVSLRLDLLRRVQELRINYLEWLPGEKREARLVFVSIEAASTTDFLVYAQSLVARQTLDRIVVDECHLTVTAADYRSSMVDLSIIRSLRTQFVYLTATLPPSMQTEFERRNCLIRLSVIRSSSNRPNIFYVVRRAPSAEGSILTQAATEAEDAWSRTGLFDHAKDKIIIYVRTREQAEELSRLLRCSSYTAGSGSVEEKTQILSEWTGCPSRPYIVATTALAEGFDYAHVRLVINVDEPDSLITFAQESGRAGRDGRPAYSLVILPAVWQAQDTATQEPFIPSSRIQDLGLHKQQERRAVRRYLQGEQCFRTSLSEYLDIPRHRRWCMPEDIACEVCQVSHQDPIGSPPLQAVESRHTGLDAISKERLQHYTELARYTEDLTAFQGACLLCRALGLPWDHAFSTCSRRTEVFEERKRARERHEARGKKWLQAYTACFWCLNPQVLCPRAGPHTTSLPRSCEHGDLVLPLCHGVFQSLGGPAWIQREFGRRFDSLSDFYDWLGEKSTFGGDVAIQAVRVAAQAMSCFRPP